MKDILISLKHKTTFYDISLKPICKGYLEELAKNLRPSDKKELIACYQKPVLEGLLYCWQRSSNSLALCYRGKVVAAAGVEPDSLLGERACVWSWTSRVIDHFPVTFWKISLLVLAYFQQQYPQLYAACDEHYLAAQRYLVKLGADRQANPVYLADKTTRFYIYQFAPSVQSNKI